MRSVCPPLYLAAWERLRHRLHLRPGLLHGGGPRWRGRHRRRWQRRWRPGVRGVRARDVQGGGGASGVRRVPPGDGVCGGGGDVCGCVQVQRVRREKVSRHREEAREFVVPEWRQEDSKRDGWTKRKREHSLPAAVTCDATAPSRQLVARLRPRSHGQPPD